MNPAQVGYISLFFIMGSLVLVSYYIYWPQYNMLAGLNAKPVFYAWCVSATLSTVGFLNFSIQMMLSEKDSQIYELTLIPYFLFLISAAFFMPFASLKKIVPTLLISVVFAASSIALAYCSFQIFEWQYTTVLVVFLAIHSTLVDLFFWGWTWTLEISNSSSMHSVKTTEFVFLTLEP